MANATHLTGTEIGLFGRVAGFIADIAESMRKSMEVRSTYAELERLSTRELNDLGISRSDISSIAFDSVYGNPKTEYRQRW